MPMILIETSNDKIPSEDTLGQKNDSCLLNFLSTTIHNNDIQ